MKTTKWIYAILFASLAWMSCDDDDDALDKPELSSNDEAFVEFAARSNYGEISLGELAQTTASDSLVKVFAQQMINEHKSAQQELKDIADDHSGIDWPDNLTSQQDSIRNRLENASGLEFDTLYIRTQVNMHQQAVTNFQDGALNSDNARVKAYANKYLPKIEMHLDKADSLHHHLAGPIATTVDATSDSGTAGDEEGTN